MSEAIIARRSGKSSSDSYAMTTKIFAASDNFTVPDTAKDNMFYVRLFGGGGAGTIVSDYWYENHYGGGGGWMNNGEFELTPGSNIPITIGRGGHVIFNANSNNIAGGTTSFGTYLSANGGASLSGGSGGGSSESRGGIGYQFGGGGGTNGGGNGGPWGGGGGTSNYADSIGYGGTYGGNGGNGNVNATNGTNTMSWTNIPSLGRGHGIAGPYYGGGGGFGGNGGNQWGGGGGYGSSGGNQWGGGGGYGNSAYGGSYIGGGGSYGMGGNGYRIANHLSVTQNGNYISSKGVMGGGGGSIDYSYQLQTSWLILASASSIGGDGICIIQYYEN